VVFAASLLLAIALPSRPGRVIPCPVGPNRSSFACGRPADHRTGERVGIVLVGMAVAAGLVVASRRLAVETEPPPGAPRPGAGPLPPDA
jgi:hypothetical protein